MFGSGILKTPEILPAADVTRLSPSEPLVGVTRELTLFLSKNAYTLVRGFIPVTVNVIFLARQNGIRARDTIRSPCDSVSICGTTEVLTPVLLLLPCSVVTVVLTIARPGTEREAAELNEVSLQVFEVDVVTPDH